MTKKDMRRELDNIMLVLARVMSRVQVLRAEMHNRSPMKRAPAISAPISAEVEASIREMYRRHPEMTHAAIARAHDLNADGRVSEIVRGKRT